MKQMGLELVSQFCYLGNVIEANGGMDGAVVARIRCAWKRFRDLKAILTMRKLSQKVKGKVLRVMMYGSETWALKVKQTRKLERTEMMMVRWICGASLKQRRTNEEFRARLGIENISVY